MVFHRSIPQMSIIIKATAVMIILVCFSIPITFLFGATFHSGYRFIGTCAIRPGDNYSTKPDES